MTVNSRVQEEHKKKSKLEVTNEDFMSASICVKNVTRV
jgi:hypothetical protein